MMAVTMITGWRQPMGLFCWPENGTQGPQLRREIRKGPHSEARNCSREPSPKGPFTTWLDSRPSTATTTRVRGDGDLKRRGVFSLPDAKDEADKTNTELNGSYRFQMNRTGF